jgi:hypothetical protein
METMLYRPVKRFLEDRGFVVKGEVCHCDIVGLKAGEPPIVVIGELKQRFNLELILQGVDRAAACDELWLAVRSSTRGRENDQRARKLCRRLGFGLLGVTASETVDILVEPPVGAPRADKRRRSRLVQEHRCRQGDPMAGGSTRAPVMTAYRQRALACAAAMANGPLRPRDLRSTLPDAPRILLNNVYGWFERAERGVYVLTAAGQSALARWPQPRAARQSGPHHAGRSSDALS